MDFVYTDLIVLLIVFIKTFLGFTWKAMLAFEKVRKAG